MHRATPVLIFASSFLFLAQATAAETAPGQAAVVGAPTLSSTEDGNQIVCRNTAIIGSRLMSRLCMPRRRWAQMHTDSQEFIRDIEQRSSSQEGH